MSVYASRDAAETALRDPAARLSLARWWRRFPNREDLAWMGEELRSDP